MRGNFERTPRKMRSSMHQPTRAGIKCNSMQHETLSNDLASWHVYRCLRYGSSRERFFLSRLEKNQKKMTADEKEEEETEAEMEDERASRGRGRETEDE